MECCLEREIAQLVHNEGLIWRPISPRANTLTTELLIALSLMKEERKEMFYLTMPSTHFILWLYGIGHMVKNHSDSERGNPLPLHGLLFPINSKDSFICIHPTERIAHTTAFVTPVVEHWLEWEIPQLVHNEGSILRPIAPRANALTTELQLAPSHWWRPVCDILWIIISLSIHVSHLGRLVSGDMLAYTEQLWYIILSFICNDFHYTPWFIISSLWAL